MKGRLRSGYNFIEYNKVNRNFVMGNFAAYHDSDVHMDMMYLPDTSIDLEIGDVIIYNDDFDVIEVCENEAFFLEYEGFYTLEEEPEVIDGMVKIGEYYMPANYNYICKSDEVIYGYPNGWWGKHDC